MLADFSIYSSGEKAFSLKHSSKQLLNLKNYYFQTSYLNEIL